jgi:hypothetical protein
MKSFEMNRVVDRAIRDDDAAQLVLNADFSARFAMTKIAGSDQIEVADP